MHSSTGPTLFDRAIVPTYNINLEKKAFKEVLPEVINAIVTSPKLTELPEVQNWMKKLLEYTVGGGKLGRGLMASIGYRMFEEPEYFSEETQHSARILGWCTEMIQVHFLILDDIADRGTIRRGKPCWYLQPNVGLSGVKDALLIYQSMLDVVDMYFGQMLTYSDVLKVINEAIYQAIMGEHLNFYSTYSKEKNNLDVFNMKLIDAIAINKSAYYTFKLPIFMALLLTKYGKQKATEELNNICMQFGRLMQCQDDYMDVYVADSVTGKTGRDIQEGKCTWVAVTALQHCNDAQRAIFKEYYGSQDPEHVKRIKQLYDELNIPQLYEQHERTMYDDILRRIHALPAEGERIFLLGVLNAIYKRVLERNLKDGKQLRGLTTMLSYEMLEKPDQITDEKLKLSRVLGWCAEMLQAYLIVVDDIMDGSTTRRGVPCWYRMPNVGLGAINDSILIHSAIMETLEIYFGKTQYYVDIIRLFNKSLLYASMGQHLDLTTAKQLKDYSLFTIDRYDSIVKYKASYYIYTLPVLLGLSLVNDVDESIGGHVNDICMKLGYLFQVQDDYIDCYGKESVTGKAGTDIQEGKCSWLAVTALQRCNESQKALFTQYYGSNEPGHVEIIKRLYDELRLPEIFRQEEKVLHDDIILKVRALPSETASTFFFKLIDSVYRRKH